MTNHFYCINHVLDSLEKIPGEDKDKMDSLVKVTKTQPESATHSDDVFILSSTPNLLNVNDDQNAQKLADLIEAVPLYHINMELILDEALAERHHNAVIENALNQAFSGQPIPSTLKAQEEKSSEDVSGNLRHPMVGHLDNKALCALFIKFLSHIPRDQNHYAFEKSILGKHTARFLEYYDGFLAHEYGMVKALILIAFGMRADHLTDKHGENHVEEGQKKARKMRIEDPLEIILAWLEADNYQTRRCMDLDRIMNFTNLPKTPNWVRADIFCCLEKEAMKQFFAKSFIDKDPSLSLIEQAPNLKQAIELNASGHANEALQQLLSQTLSQANSYSGAAGKFVELAKKREADAKKIRLL